MTRKVRSTTLCEWALGVSVEEYCDSLQRRRCRKSSGKQRISVEISTDDESEEDTVKITYPRTGRGKNSSSLSSNVKKVRFENAPPKSALKAADSDAESSGKEDKEEVGRVDVSESEEEPKPKKTEKKKKQKASKKQKVIESSSESEDSEAETTETETESEDESPPSPKKQEKTKENNKVAKKAKNKAKSPNIESNNVGPASKKRPEKAAVTEKAMKSKATEKLRPEPALSPHLRRPNLIMPVRAAVLQVEHAIEGVEDPRPNAFVDPQHGVVRVYHGPAYGNPYGLLYPARDPSKAALPVGVPHPLQNPYFNGFAHPVNPGDNHFKGQTPWGSVPITCMPGGPPAMASVDTMQLPQFWTQASPVKAASAKGSPEPVMSGAIQRDTPSTKGNDKEKDWNTNFGPEGGKAPSPPAATAAVENKPNNNVAPTSPINATMTVNPNTSWAVFSSNSSKKSSPDKNGSQTRSKKSWGSKKSNSDWVTLPSGQHRDLGWGDASLKGQGSNSGWPQTTGSNSGREQTREANNDYWGANAGATGSNSGWNTSGDGQNNDVWGSAGNAQSNGAQGPSGDNVWGTMNDTSGDFGSNNQGTANNVGWSVTNGQVADPWADSNYKNNWSTASNHSNSNTSKKSNKSQNGGSNRSGSGPSNMAANWDGQSNNVGFTGPTPSQGSNGSRHSRQSQAAAASTNGGWDNNAGPTTNSPMGSAINKSGGSKQSSKKGSNNNEAWGNVGDTSTWISDNNAGPTTNSPNASQTSKKSDKNGNPNSAGSGAGWGPCTTGGEFNYNTTGTEMSKGSSSSKSMPGAWDPSPPWADLTVAQSTNGAADCW